jgi:GTPase SAR1 family protein
VEYDVKTVKKYEEDLKANITGGKSPVVVSFLDLGGQEVFYALHPYFITSAGLFLIVFNMEHLLPTAPAEERAEALAYIKRWINATIVSAAVIALNVVLYNIVQL